ncbi:unnamed protein product [Diatraea saccharalis]|uniref:Uncharacterized protein n=1 Tax=Diatraea saccharalis TaxID=40085 RepID=A0A9N9R4E8_9NEOP|nr:unnamed protein product [Diatraea saccharalis]CAG9789414.1 unnamed protein product [Diatraea saccharalis]
MGIKTSDINQSAEFFMLSGVNCTNESVVSEIRYDPLYPYALNSNERWLMFKCLIGTLIIVCNLTVVISSGLIIKKGQQPKSTYLLLGNVSLADTMIGIFMIFVGILGTSMRSDQLCIFRLGK